MIKRAFGFDPKTCDHCGAEMVVMAMISAPRILERILTHLSLPTHPPPGGLPPQEEGGNAPARQDPQSELGVDEHPPDEAYLDKPPDEHDQLASCRAPP